MLEPDPVDLASVGLGGADAGKGKGPSNGNPDDARWSGEARCVNILHLPIITILILCSFHLAVGLVGLRISTRVLTLTLGLPPPRFRTYCQNIFIKPFFVKVVEKKEMPTWISESTVRTAEDQVLWSQN